LSSGKEEKIQRKEEGGRRLEIHRGGKEINVNRNFMLFGHP